MKNYILLLVSIFFVMQSCTSYRAVSNDAPTFISGKKYKIKQSEKWMKVKVVSSDSTTIKVQHNSETKIIDRASVTQVKQRKFSVIKTVALIPVVVTTVAVGIYMADPEINIPLNYTSPN